MDFVFFLSGYDLIEWLMEKLQISDSMEALHLANLLCQHGYFFPVTDTKSFVVKDDSSLYRFQVRHIGLILTLMLLVANLVDTK